LWQLPPTQTRPLAAQSMQAPGIDQQKLSLFLDWHPNAWLQQPVSQHSVPMDEVQMWAQHRPFAHWSPGSQQSTGVPLLSLHAIRPGGQQKAFRGTQTSFWPQQ
jgi:hypothetical protein